MGTARLSSADATLSRLAVRRPQGQSDPGRPPPCRRERVQIRAAQAIQHSARRPSIGSPAPSISRVVWPTPSSRHTGLGFRPSQPRRQGEQPAQVQRHVSVVLPNPHGEGPSVGIPAKNQQAVHANADGPSDIGVQPVADEERPSRLRTFHGVLEQRGFWLAGHHRAPAGRTSNGIDECPAARRETARGRDRRIGVGRHPGQAASDGDASLGQQRPGQIQTTSWITATGESSAVATGRSSYSSSAARNPAPPTTSTADPRAPARRAGEPPLEPR